MDTREPGFVEVIRAAERIHYREKWRAYEERAGQRLAHTSSLAWTRLFPDSPVIQVVAVNGVVVGRVRRDGNHWLATAIGHRGAVADRGAFDEAVGALASEVTHVHHRSPTETG